MKKITLQFNSLADLAAFSKSLNEGFLIDTSHLTIVLRGRNNLIDFAKKNYQAITLERSASALSPN